MENRKIHKIVYLSLHRVIILLVIVLYLQLNCFNCLSLYVDNKSNKQIKIKIEKYSNRFTMPLEVQTIGYVSQFEIKKFHCVETETFTRIDDTMSLNIMVLSNDSILDEKEFTIEELERKNWRIKYNKRLE